MRSGVGISLCAAAVSLTILRAWATDATPPFPRCVAIHRSPERTFLLAETDGLLFSQTGLESPKEYLRLPLPRVARRGPTGMTLWKSEWLVANNTDRILRFSADGRYLGDRAVPAVVSDISTAGETLWLHHSLGARGVAEFWTSRDGANFEAAPGWERGTRRGTVAAIVEGQSLLAGGRSGELLVVYRVGPPTLYRLASHRPAEVWPLAYRRSRARAALERYRPDREELTDYSLPALDLAPEGDGTVLVLRNREDRVASDRGQVIEEGRRVDRYAADSAHMGTAEFSEGIRWILRTWGKEVLGLTRNGRLQRAAFGRPQPGGLVD